MVMQLMKFFMTPSPAGRGTLKERKKEMDEEPSIKTIDVGVGFQPATVVTISPALRWVYNAMGEKVLQQCVRLTKGGRSSFEWRDVPTEG